MDGLLRRVVQPTLKLRVRLPAGLQERAYMEPFPHHVFVCTQEKPEGVASCPKNGSLWVLQPWSENSSDAEAREDHARRPQAGEHSRRIAATV